MTCMEYGLFGDFSNTCKCLNVKMDFPVDQGLGKACGIVKKEKCEKFCF